MGFVSICCQQRNAHSSVLSSSGGGVFCSRCTALSCLCHSSSHFFPGSSYFILPCTSALAPDLCLLCSNTPPDLLHVSAVTLSHQPAACSPPGSSAYSPPLYPHLVLFPQTPLNWHFDITLSGQTNYLFLIFFLGNSCFTSDEIEKKYWNERATLRVIACSNGLHWRSQLIPCYSELLVPEVISSKKYE